MAYMWRDWVSVGEGSLKYAHGAIDTREYHIVAFFAQQCAARMLEALWLIEADGVPPRTHNLVEVAQGLDAPEAVLSACSRLTPHYLAARYPDVAGGNPADNYTKTVAEELLASAEEVSEWCSNRLPS